MTLSLHELKDGPLVCRVGHRCEMDTGDDAGAGPVHSIDRDLMDLDRTHATDRHGVRPRYSHTSEQIQRLLDLSRVHLELGRASGPDDEGVALVLPVGEDLELGHHALWRL